MINLGELIHDPDFCDTFTIIRNTGSTWSKGVQTSTTSTIEFEGIVSPASSKDIEMLPEGDRQVFNENGTWGLNDMQDNTPLVLLLAVNVLIFNIGDFFAANGLSELRKSLSGLSLANIKM